MLLMFSKMDLPIPLSSRNCEVACSNQVPMCGGKEWGTTFTIAGACLAPYTKLKACICQSGTITAFWGEKGESQLEKKGNVFNIFNLFQRA